MLTITILLTLFFLKILVPFVRRLQDKIKLVYFLLEKEYAEMPLLRDEKIRAIFLTEKMIVPEAHPT